MPDTCDCPVEVERNEDGRHVVAFPDFGSGATDGATRDEALSEARCLLREFLTIATASLASMNASGEVLVSNFFDVDADSRGNLLSGDDQKLECDSGDQGHRNSR